MELTKYLVHIANDLLLLWSVNKIIRFHFILSIDVANPLIGDVSEYERFVVIVIEKSMTTPPVPADHVANDQPATNNLQLVRMD